MTSPSMSPEAFHFRPTQEAPKTRAWACTCCGKWYLTYQVTCPCHTSSLLHSVDLTDEQMANAKAGQVIG